jgi:hypothetical protein
VRVIAQDAAVHGCPRYSPDGARVAFVASHQAPSTPCPSSWPWSREDGRWAVLSQCRLRRGARPAALGGGRPGRAAVFRGARPAPPLALRPRTSPRRGGGGRRLGARLRQGRGHAA